MENLRTPFLLAALVLILIVVLVELGSTALVGQTTEPAGSLQEAFAPYRGDVSDEQIEAARRQHEGQRPPGMGVSDLALLDAVLLFTIALMAAALLVPERVQGRLQGIVTLVASIVLLILAVLLAIKAFVLLLIMVALFSAVPFGTLAYLAIWGFFDRGGARVALTLIMGLKLAFVVCLLLAHQRFLQLKSLVLLTVTSLVATVVVSFLHGLVPIILVSITDAIAAIVVCVLAIIWAVVLLVGSLPAIVKALRVSQA
jgi:hypothetical protein